MSSFKSVLDELESALQSGAMGRRTTVLRQITDLFTSGAENFSQQQIALFDDVMSHLISHIESRALVELSSRIAPVANAPARVIRRLATDDAIEVAGPVLAQSEQLTRDDLIEIAKSSGQAHLMKIASRSRLDEAVTDVLVDRGDSEVANQVAANSGARFSKTGYSKLVLWAEGDDQLTATLARRSDIDPHLFRQLLAHATETVRETLIASAQPEQPQQRRDVAALCEGAAAGVLLQPGYGADEKQALRICQYQQARRNGRRPVDAERRPDRPGGSPHA